MTRIQLNLKNYTLNKSNHFIFTDAMSKDTKNQQCIGADGQPGCVLNVLVGPSPGIELGLEKITLDSNIVLNYSRTTDALTYDELHTPNTIVTAKVWVDGVSPGESNAFIASEFAEINFDIRPTGSADEWATLAVMETDNLSPVGHKAGHIIDQVGSGEGNHFTNSLFIESDAYTMTGSGGFWENKFNFELRACIRPSFSEADISASFGSFPVLV